MIKCKYCKKEIPNKDMITKNGCVWCSEEYHKNKNNDKIKDK